MIWIVYFAFIGLDLDLPDGMSARWHAKFPDRATCEAWIAEVEQQEPRKIEIVSECREQAE